MTQKKKHPQTRAERLKIKRLKFEEHQKEREASGKVRQLYKEWLRDEETANELRTHSGAYLIEGQLQ